MLSMMLNWALVLVTVPACFATVCQDESLSLLQRRARPVLADESLRQNASVLASQVQHSDGLIFRGGPEDLKCFRNTGETCLLFSCPGWRGETKCDKDHWCVCKPGFCAGADGICHAAQNTLVAKGVRITSVKYPKYSMKVDKAEHGILHANVLWLEDDPAGTQELFNLWLLPQRKGEKYQNDVIIESVAFPGQVVYTERQSCGKNCWQTVISISHPYHFWGGPDAHAFTLARNSKESPNIWMRSAGFYTKGAVVYTGTLTWSVQAGHALFGNWGDEALWTPHPPLSLELPVKDVR
mmetsp:Transcript_95965/g.248540  ORF Transcript_95965/g.248540 Transcript_95965/m.248540 type:complete len:296 (+) Transcript_95965:44-931(+)